MNSLENMGSPGKEEDFEWDPAESTITAWSASNTRTTKGRRAYGRRGSKKTTKNGDKRRANQRRRQFQEMALEEEEESLIQRTSSHNSAEWTTSSSSSFDLTRSETLPIPPPPGPVGRSHSTTSLSGGAQTRPPLLRHSRSMSVRSDYRRDSSASISSSSAESRFGQSENMQPNINASSLLSPQPPTKLKKIDMTPSDNETKGSARKKLRQRHNENDLSDSSPSFLSPNNNNSFSRLAKSAELAAAWIKPPEFSPTALKDTIGFDFGCLGAVNTSSPTASVATTSSSRKRGVCELPFDDNVEESGYSFMSTTSSYETRSRSRSRIFSQGSFSKSLSADDAPDPSELFARNGSSEDIDSHDEKSHDDDHSSAVRSESSDDESMEHDMDIDHHEDDVAAKHDEKEENEKSLVPPQPVRRSSNDFEKTVFGSKNQPAVKDPLDPSQICETMSDYEDLKFLIKALRKEKHGSTIASFGTTKTWTIAPPSAWDSRRRTAFLQWASRGLGFSLRAGGGAVAFLQTNVTKGDVILLALEAALVAHKASAKNDKDVGAPSRPVPKNIAILSSRYVTYGVMILMASRTMLYLTFLFRTPHFLQI
jgi:hypothetical protein